MPSNPHAAVRVPILSRGRSFVLAALAAGALLPAARAADPSSEPAPEAPAYELGRGLRLAGGGLTLGGYLTVEAQKVGGRVAQLRASHASVFLWWEPLDRLKLLAEVDHENAVVRVRRRDVEGDADSRRTSLERLHADWAFGDALTVRAGKFLTPVGRWNLVHADPLVWTTNRPLLTTSAYPHNVTGLMAFGAIEVGRLVPRWWAYASNGTEWDADPRQDPFATVRGVRLLVPLGSAWQAGLSWARYEQRGSRGEPRTLKGADLLWSGGGWELSAEWLQTQDERRSGPPRTPFPSTPSAIRYVPGNASPVRPPGGPFPFGPGGPSVPTRGLYLQGVAPLAPQWFAVARVERIRDNSAAGTLEQRTAGLAWRPWPAMSVKVEHQSARGRDAAAPDGWTASLSVLF